MSFSDTPPADAGGIPLSEILIRWQKRYGRHDLPWQQSRDAYAVWLSEIMLQQTQVATVIPYYRRFLERFPDVFALAAAPQQAVMELWSGLGYYSRARNLHRCAGQIVADHGGVFSSDPAVLAQLPGIGRSTAAAIAVFAYGVRAAIMDGNVMRVFARVYGIEGYPGSKPVKDALWRLAEDLLPQEDIESYTQGLMDLGATVCVRSRPACHSCPLAERCVAFNAGRTAELPSRKPKKTLPQKRIVMLVLTHSGDVLLERRPDAGIWGGLLSLPELPLPQEEGVGADVMHSLLQQVIAPFGTPGGWRAHEPFVHTFSHYRLHVEPLHVELAQIVPVAAQSGHVWWPMSDLEQAPLPAPVRKLLQRMPGAAPEQESD